MPGPRSTSLYPCVHRLRASQRQNALPIQARTPSRPFSSVSALLIAQDNSAPKVAEQEDKETIPSQVHKPSAVLQNGREQGAMSRRLSEATENALLEGGRAGRKAVEEAGFSEELKKKLLEKIEMSSFRSENKTAFAEVELSSSVGRGSRDIATGQAWSGTENTEDTVLRMLDDGRKHLTPRLRGSTKIPQPVVDLRLRKVTKERLGDRLANARDKTSIYAISKDANLTDKERDDMRRELKERFGPTARSMPSSISGLAALANERIENAISRGQFKNIPRGKDIERDARADNPFIDTTEYIMNKMIQRQDIVPPWIEKQQELVKEANIFRARLRNDWKRHAARTIASRGGSLQEQMTAAERYAEAEKRWNPKERVVEQVFIPTNVSEDQVTVKIVQDVSSSNESKSPAVQVSLETEDGGIPAAKPPNVQTLREVAVTEAEKVEAAPLPPPFRIPSWEATERSYLVLAIKNLNSLTRSYNLMAPDLAKKPYFSLEREMNSCYADIAPQLATAIKERAASPPRNLVEKTGHTSGGVLERFSKEDRAKIYDSRKPLYGWKEFWKDLLKKRA